MATPVPTSLRGPLKRIFPLEEFRVFFLVADEREALAYRRPEAQPARNTPTKSEDKNLSSLQSFGLASLDGQPSRESSSSSAVAALAALACRRLRE